MWQEQELMLTQLYDEVGGAEQGGHTSLYEARSLFIMQVSLNIRYKYKYREIHYTYAPIILHIAVRSILSMQDSQYQYS